MSKKNRLTSLESNIEEEPASLIARIRAAMPLIEANLRAGHSLRNVHQLLQNDGIAISYRLLAVYRCRIKREKEPLETHNGGFDNLQDTTPSESSGVPPPPQDGFDPEVNYPEASEEASEI